MAAESKLKLRDMTAETVFDKIVEKGISEADAAIITSGWIFQNFGKTKRTFNYAQQFPEVEPECIVEFKRTFEHIDWVDGESVVQAEKTTVAPGRT